MTGLQVAPTAPHPIPAASSAGGAESFHRRVGVSRAMRRRGGAGGAAVARSVISLLGTELSAGCAGGAPGGRGGDSPSVVRPRRRAAGGRCGLVAARVRRAGAEQATEGLVDLVDRLDD